MRILIDNREQAPFAFKGYEVDPEPATLPVGDYSLLERYNLAPASRPAGEELVRCRSIKRGNLKMQKLKRATFEVSRELEFFSEKELQMQIGHGRGLWPVALLKELIDNALDACEASNLPPLVEVEIWDDAFGVRDNGPGLPKKTLMRSLDYLVRVSDKTYYVSPTRGQLGNALKLVWAAPFVAHGATAVWRYGVRGCITPWRLGLTG